ncbi:hypothetical protein FIBSPDRAFT_954639 [Athelia psychrophila]|uniref:BTB domain-containing protein n=1 Tax=Athelia psychrophila TaxID=1759441 RepID=A0A166IWT9_9AGAM|nr:hypothetical protein FIBSPDRAFT_954639 [Fibularhizoctonia sp. CBS 109695]
MSSKRKEGKLEEGNNIKTLLRGPQSPSFLLSNESRDNKRKADPDIASSSLPKKIKHIEVPTIKRSELYWYKDGNVIIQIEDTHFELYRGQLSRASNFFARLLQGSDENPLGPKLHDPLYVHVTEINAADFILLLEWLKT